MTFLLIQEIVPMFEKPRQSALPQVWELPEEFEQRLGTGPGRQRAMYTDDHLLLVLHAPPEPDQEERQGRFFWRHPDGTWNSDSLGAGFSSLESHVEEYDHLLDAIEEELGQATHANQTFEVLRKLGPITRATANLCTALEEARRATPDVLELIDIRDHAYRVARTAELLYADARNAMDYAIASRAEEHAANSNQMAIAAHRLNMLVAFFFPIATLTTVFGVNLTHGLENYRPPLPFLTVLLSGVILGGVLILIVSRRAAIRE